MATRTQLDFNKRFHRRLKKTPYSDTSRLSKNPQLKGVVLRLAIVTPKKPNSALRHVNFVRLYKNKRKAIVRILGDKFRPIKFNRVLVEGGRANDLPAVRYSSIRGALDCTGFFG
jgi:small subunit ribosomal protein S12